MLLPLQANARNTLINAGGIVEKIFVTGKYGKWQQQLQLLSF